jgi:hypothetical protein
MHMTPFPPPNNRCRDTLPSTMAGARMPRSVDERPTLLTLTDQVVRSTPS